MTDQKLSSDVEVRQDILDMAIAINEIIREMYEIHGLAFNEEGDSMDKIILKSRMYISQFKGKQ